MRADYSLKMLASDALLLKLMVMMLMISLASSTRQQSDSDRVSQGRKCSPGQFHQVSSGTCQACSDCPLNQIIRKPCSDQVDTTCSPFYEFENFHQGSDDIDEEDENDLGLNEDDEKTATGLWSTHPLKSKSGESVVKDNNAAAEESPLQQRTDVAEVITPQAEGPSVESDVLRWKQLCFGLIGALAVITFIAFLYILLTQLYARRHPGKTIAIADPDDPAIYYRTRVFSRERLNTSDYKVNLDHLEADSETHHGKKWLLWRLFHPRSHRHYGRVYEVDSHGLFPLQIIPNRGAMMDGDHLDVPEVHIMGSTDSGFSAETRSNVPI